MTTTEARNGATDIEAAAQGAAAEINDETLDITEDTRSRAGQIRGAIEGAIDHVPDVIDSAQAGVVRVADHLPEVADRARMSVEQTTTRLQALPDKTLQLLAAGSVGLATGLRLAGAPSVISFLALAPALLAGGAMATRRGSLLDRTA